VRPIIVLFVALAAQWTAFAGQVRPPVFEAVSIKRNTSGETRIRFETPPGRVNAINVPLRFVIRQAYRVPESRIVGGPVWLDFDRFDIVATAPAAATGDAVREMLRALLTERYGLRMRAETREMPVYLLRLMRTDGALGSKLRRSTMDCAGRPSSVVAGQVQCGVLVSQGPASASLRGGGATIDSFVRLLGDFLDRPLIDESGLTGTFDLELQFSAPRSSMPGAPVPGAGRRRGPRRRSHGVHRSARATGFEARRPERPRRGLGRRCGLASVRRLATKIETWT
jgi:uncharacterized protein (TIGR03435 family)